MEEDTKKTLIKDGATLSAGLAMRWMINHGFDYIVYPIVLVTLGTKVGGMALIIFATVANAALIRAYDWSKTDWFLIEKLKSNVANTDHTGFKQKIFNFLKRNDILMFFILNLDDPITATLYLRKGHYQYNGMIKRDWIIFIASNIVSNLYWIAGWTAVIAGFRAVISFF
jgi:hypothetical protein